MRPGLRSRDPWRPTADRLLPGLRENSDRPEFPLENPPRGYNGQPRLIRSEDCSFPEIELQIRGGLALAERRIWPPGTTSLFANFAFRHSANSPPQFQFVESNGSLGLWILSQSRGILLRHSQVLLWEDEGKSIWMDHRRGYFGYHCQRFRRTSWEKCN